MRTVYFKSCFSLVVFGFICGIAAGAVLTGSLKSSEAIAAGEQRIERFSDACVRSANTGNQPKACASITH